MRFWRKGIRHAIWPPLPVWKRLDLAVFAVGIYSILVYAIEKLAEIHIPEVGSFTAALNTIILGVLLSFRNKEAYDRWWEARRLWGQLVNDSRNLSLKIRHMATLSNDDRSKLGRTIAAFPVALRNHLRGVGTLQDVPGFQTSSAMPVHVPAHVAAEIMAIFQSWRRSNKMTEIDMLFMEPHIRGFMDVCGGCERIRSTPVPPSYRALLRHGLVLYLASTPWLLGQNLGFASAPVMCLTAYFLLGIEMTAEDVEDPFGRDGDDLTLTTFCETIRKSAADILGVGLMPAPSSLEAIPPEIAQGPKSGKFLRG